MKKIMKISEYIKEEMEDAEKYIKKAAKCKGIDDALAETAIEIAAQEIKHAEMWHELAVKEIAITRAQMKEKGEAVPAFMIEIWEDKHAEYIEAMARIKHELDLVKK